MIGHQEPRLQFRNLSFSLSLLILADSALGLQEAVSRPACLSGESRILPHDQTINHRSIKHSTYLHLYPGGSLLYEIIYIAADPVSFVIDRDCAVMKIIFRIPLLLLCHQSCLHVTSYVDALVNGSVLARNCSS